MALRRNIYSPTTPVGAADQGQILAATGTILRVTNISTDVLGNVVGVRLEGLDEPVKQVTFDHWRLQSGKSMSEV